MHSIKPSASNKGNNVENTIFKIEICTFAYIRYTYYLMETYIFIENARFFSYHGVGEQEQLVGNEFIINLKLKVDILQAGKTDELSDTISYADVYDVIKREMAIPSKLLEHVCYRISTSLFHLFPTIEAIDLKLAKRNPPIGADLDCAGVEVHYKQQDFIESGIK